MGRRCVAREGFKQGGVRDAYARDARFAEIRRDSPRFARGRLRLGFEADTQQICGGCVEETRQVCGRYAAGVQQIRGRYAEIRGRYAEIRTWPSSGSSESSM